MLLGELFCWTYTLDLVSSSENKKHHEVQFKDHWHVNGLLLMRPNKKARAKMLKRSKDRTWNANNWAGYFKNQLLEMIFCPNVVTDIWSVKYFLILVLKGCWAGSQTWTVVQIFTLTAPFSPGDAIRLLTVQRKTIGLLNVKSLQFDAIQTTMSDPVALTFDVTRGWYYWADNQGSIYKSDGQNSSTIYTG